MPYLAGAAGVIVAVLLALAAWVAVVLGLEAQRSGAVGTETLGRAGLVLAVAAMTVTPVAYLGGVPVAVALEWGLRRAGPDGAGKVRYLLYLLAGLAFGALLGAVLATVRAEAVAITLLGGMAAVAGAATMRLALRRPVLGRRLAITVPAVLAVAALVVPGG